VVSSGWIQPAEELLIFNTASGTNTSMFSSTQRADDRVVADYVHVFDHPYLRARRDNRECDRSETSPIGNLLPSRRAI
jgi:hypothetical protein